MTTRALRCSALLAVPLLLAATLAPGAAAAPAGTQPDSAATAATAPTGTPVTPANAQEFLDARLPELLAEHQAPGVAATIVAEGEQAASAAHGYADLANEVPLDQDEHVFPTASVAKSFTAAAVLQLAEDGEVDLHEDVNTYLPGDVRVPDTHPGEPVTLHHLLTHTPGFAEVSEWDDRDAPDSWRTLEEALRDADAERIFGPEQFIAYSNHGYALAGLAVQEVSGLSFEDYVDENVFAPLGMEASEFGDVPELEARDEVVTLHQPDGSTAANDHIGGAPAGGAVTTTDDMARFMLALLGDGELDGERVLSTDSVEAMLGRQFEIHPDGPAMGYGTYEWRTGPPRGVGHGGDLQGLHTGYVMLPELDTGLFVAVNGDDAEEDGNPIADLRFSVLHAFADEFGPAEPRSAQADPDTDLDRYTGTYTTTRRSTTGVDQITSLFDNVRVRDTGDGALQVSGAIVPDERWLPAGDGVFVAENGEDELVFVAEDGEADGVYLNLNPTNGYDRAGLLSNPFLHVGIAAAGLVVLFTGFVHLRRPRGAGPVFARVVGSLTGLSCFVGVGLVVYALADINRLRDWTLSDSPALTLPLTIAVPLTALTAAAAVTAWVRGWWGPVGRVHYSLLPLAAIAVIAVGATYGFVWLPS